MKKIANKIKDLFGVVIGKANGLLDKMAQKLHTTKKRLLIIIGVFIALIVGLLAVILWPSYDQIPKDALVLIDANKRATIKEAGFSVGSKKGATTKYAAKWNVDDKADFEFINYPNDISQKDTMKFKYRLDSEKQARVMFYFGSENPDTKDADYYSYTITLKAGEWKEMSIDMSRLAIYGEPLGLDKLTEVSIRTTGWLNSAEEGSVIRFGHMYLVGDPVVLNSYSNTGQKMPHFTQTLMNEAAELAADPTGWPRFYVGSGLDSHTNSTPALDCTNALYYMALAVYYNEMDPTAEPLVAANGLEIKQAVIQLLEFFLRGGNEPAATVGSSWGHAIFANALLQIKNTEAIYNELSQDTKDRMDWMMRALAVASNWGFNDENNFETGFHLKGNWSKHWNMNYKWAYLSTMATASLYFGNAELNHMLINFSYDTYMNKFRELDYINVIWAWETAGKSLMETGVTDDGSGPVAESLYTVGATIGTLVGDSLGSGKGVKLPFKYTCTINGVEQTLTLEQEDFAQKLFAYLAENTFSEVVTSTAGTKGTEDYSYIMGEVVGEKTDSVTGETYDVYSELTSPFEGRIGMMDEFAGVDAYGIRSCAGYSYLSAQVVVSCYQNVKLYAGWDSSTEYMQALDEQIYVGIEDMFYKMEKGYRGWANGEERLTYDWTYEPYGSGLVKDIWKNVHCGWDANVKMLENPNGNAEDLEAVDPLGGVNVAPQGALKSYDLYAKKFREESFTSIGRLTSGTVKFDLVVGDKIPKEAGRGYDAVVSLMSKGVGETWDNMETSVQLYDQKVRVRSGSDYAMTGFAFDSNYRYQIEMKFDAAQRIYSVVVRQIYPELEKVYEVNNIPMRTSGDRVGYIDSIGVFTSMKGSDLWLENVYVNGNLIKGTNIKYETKVGVKPKDEVGPVTQLRVHRDEFYEFVDYTTGKDATHVKRETVVMTAEDKDSEIKNLSYYVSKKPLSETAVKKISAWKTAKYDVACFKLNPYEKTYVYVRSIDAADNVTYVSGCYFLDRDLPVISGVKDGVTYCETQTVKITDSYLDSVNINGDEKIDALATDGSYLLEKNSGTHDIVAMDRAGNTRKLTVRISDTVVKDKVIVDGMDDATIDKMGWDISEDAYKNNLYSASTIVKDVNKQISGISGDFRPYEELKFSIKIDGKDKKAVQKFVVIFHAGSNSEGKEMKFEARLSVKNNKWTEFSIPFSEFKVTRNAKWSDITSMRIWTHHNDGETGNVPNGSTVQIGHMTLKAGKETRVHAQNHGFVYVPGMTDTAVHDYKYTCCDTVVKSEPHIKSADSDKCSVCGQDMNTIVDISNSGEVWDAVSSVDEETHYTRRKKVLIQAQDYGFGIAKLEYATSGSYVGEDDLRSLRWTTISGVFSLSLEESKSLYVYARVTDRNGKVTYASSPKLVYDVTIPTISGIQDGVTYCKAPVMKVTDTNLDTVKVGASTVELQNGEYAFEDNSGRQKIVATDKAGNSTTITITVSDTVLTDKIVIDGNDSTTINKAGWTVDGSDRFGQNHYSASMVVGDGNNKQIEGLSGDFRMYDEVKFAIKIKATNNEKGQKFTIVFHAGTNSAGQEKKFELKLSAKNNQWAEFSVTLSDIKVTREAEWDAVTSVRLYTDYNSKQDGNIPKGSTVYLGYMYFTAGEETRVHADASQRKYVASQTDTSVHEIQYACCNTVVGHEKHQIGADGKCIKCVPPTISGVTNGGIYCSGPEITVTDSSGLKSVTVNGEAVTLDKEGKYKIPDSNGDYEIKVVDAYNCITICNIEVYSNALPDSTTLQNTGFTMDMGGKNDYKWMSTQEGLGSLLEKYSTMTYNIKLTSDTLANGTEVIYYMDLRKDGSNQYLYRVSSKVGQTTTVTIDLNDYTQVKGTMKGLEDVTGIMFRAHVNNYRDMEQCTAEVSDLVLTGLTTPKTHIYQQIVSEHLRVDSNQVANCVTGLTYYKSCACGEQSTETFNGAVDPDNHTKDTYTYVSLNNKQHNQLHECCGAVVCTEAHKNSAVTTVGSYDCEYCGTPYYDYLDHDAPVIHNIENGKTYYNVEPKMLVQDAMLESVTVNGKNIDINTNVSANSAEYTFTTAIEPYVIVATDIAGNVTTYTINVWEKETLFETDFENSVQENQGLIKDGWTAHSDYREVNVKNKNIVMPRKMPGNPTSQPGWRDGKVLGLYPLDSGETIGKGDWAGPRIIKHLDTKGFDNLVVEFEVLLTYEAECKQNGEPNFYVGTLYEDNVTKQWFEGTNGSDKLAHMEQVFWKLDNNETASSSIDKQWTNVKLEFDIIDESTATVTPYVKDGDKWVADNDYAGTEVKLDDGMLRLAFACRTYVSYDYDLTGANPDLWFARAFMDNVNMYGVIKDVAKKPPVIEGIRDGGIYSVTEEATMTITDYDLKTVTVNGKAVEVNAASIKQSASYTFDSKGTYTIIAVDDANHTVTYTIDVVEAVTIFETDFNNSTDTSLLNEDGWTAHSDKDNGGKAKYNNVKIDSKGKYLKLYPVDSNSGRWAGPRIIKHLDISSFDKVTVNFDFAVYYEAETGINTAPTFTIGVLKDDDVSKQYCEGNTSGADNKASMEQVFWQYAARETQTTTYWKSVKLDFEIVDNNTAKVTAYVSDQGVNNWVIDEDYQDIPVQLENGVLKLAFVGTTYAKYHSNEAWFARLYMDNVKMYGVSSK